MANFFNFMINHAGDILNIANAIIAALITIFLLVPGEQPEKALHDIADFLSKFSRKKDDPGE